mgnify:CR=1 FL=1
MTLSMHQIKAIMDKNQPQHIIKILILIDPYLEQINFAALIIINAMVQFNQILIVGINYLHFVFHLEFPTCDLGNA